MIEKHPTTKELLKQSFLACHKAIGSVVPLDIMHMMGAGVHLRWGLFGEKFGCKAKNNTAVLQNEKTGTVLVFEARPEGDTVTQFNFGADVMREYYQATGGESPIEEGDGL